MLEGLTIYYSASDVQGAMELWDIISPAVTEWRSRRPDIQFEGCAFGVSHDIRTKTVVMVKLRKAVDGKLAAYDLSFEVGDDIQPPPALVSERLRTVVDELDEFIARQTEHTCELVRSQVFYGNECRICGKWSSYVGDLERLHARQLDKE